MERQRLYYLLDRYTRRLASAPEIKELNQLDLESEEANRVLLLELLTEGFDKYQEQGFDTTGFDDLYQRALAIDRPTNELLNEPPVVPIVRRVRLLHRGWFKYAAAILLLVGITTALVVSLNRQDRPAIDLSKKEAPEDVSPGSNKALLTLSDGTTIVLDSAANGTLAQQGSASVTKLADGEVVYNMKGSPDGEALMNTLQTPIGGQYRLTLPDGTKVWLNAASSIAYPAAFTGHDRKVKISGEVYLEVAKNKAKPFIVDVDGKSTIEVLGTGFNINAYTNEAAIKTTLVEGSIKLNASIILKPGQQAQINPAVTNLQPKLITVNTDQVTAWKNGYFNFENVSLREMGRQIERWYNVKVDIIGALNDISLKGEMDRGVKLSDIMRFFNDCGFQTILNNGVLTVKQ